MKNSLSLLLFLFISQCLNAQSLGFSVRGTYQQGVAKQILTSVSTISDLNTGYPASWVSGYISVDVRVTPKDGQGQLASGKDDNLTKEQIALLKQADYNSDINVLVKYQPKGSEVKEVDFTYTVIPEEEADYIGGQDALRAYVKEHAMVQIPEEIHKEFEFAAIAFKIGKNGEILDPKIIHESDFPEVDKMLLQFIKKMPAWKAAKNAMGENLIQDFVLNVGYMEGC